MTVKRPQIQISISMNDFVFDSSSDFHSVAQHVVDAEDLGVDMVWSAEAWGTDAVVPLAFVAALTSRIKIAAGILQISARTPVMTAMTAMTLDHVSNGRFILGLGVSGPQVVEGMHGQRYERPLERLRETVDVIRIALAGNKVEYHGQQIDLPLANSQGKAIRIGQPARPNLPIYLATLGPRALRYTGAVADGWVGTCFVPEKSKYYFEHLSAGAQSTGRKIEDLEITAGGPIAFTDDIERPLLARKKALAFQLGAMGSAETNFYNNAFSQIGFAEPAHRVQELWIAGKRDEAMKAVPDELAIGTSLMGNDAEVTSRIRAYRDAGVTNLRLDPIGRTPTEKLDSLARVLELVKLINRETPA